MMKSGSRTHQIFSAPERWRRGKPKSAFDDVERPGASLFENPLQILAEDANHQQLHAAEHQHREHHRRPALHARAEENLVDEHVDPKHEAQTRDEYAEK